MDKKMRTNSKLKPDSYRVQGSKLKVEMVAFSPFRGLGGFKMTINYICSLNFLKWKP